MYRSKLLDYSFQAWLNEQLAASEQYITDTNRRPEEPGTVCGASRMPKCAGISGQPDDCW